MRKVIRLTESDLHRIIKESVRRIIKEEDLKWGSFKDDYVEPRPKPKRVYNTVNYGNGYIADNGGSQKGNKTVEEGVPDPSDCLRDEPGNKSVDRFGNEIEYDEDGNELYADFWDDL